YGDGVERAAVGEPDSAGRSVPEMERRDEPVGAGDAGCGVQRFRTERDGDGPDGRLLVSADLGHGGGGAVAGHGRRFERHGDVRGARTATTVALVEGRGVGPTPPSARHVLTWNGVRWGPRAPTGQATSTFGRTGAVTSQTGDYSFAQISGSATAGQLPPAGGD